MADKLMGQTGLVPSAGRDKQHFRPRIRPAKFRIEPRGYLRLSLPEAARRNANRSIFWTPRSQARSTRWWAGSTAETQGGVFKMRDDRPAPRITAAPHRTP